jgi:hypothetical protein
MVQVFQTARAAGSVWCGQNRANSDHVLGHGGIPSALNVIYPMGLLERQRSWLCGMAAAVGAACTCVMTMWKPQHGQIRDMLLIISNMWSGQAGFRC